MAAFSSVVTEVTSVAELADIQSGKLVLFFWAAWHEPSQPGGQMDSVIAQLAADAASVSLRFAGCRNLTHTAVQALAGALAQATSISLDFRFCRNLTGAFVQALAGGLAQATSVSLNFAGCSNLTDAAAQALRRALPQAKLS